MNLHRCIAYLFIIAGFVQSATSQSTDCGVTWGPILQLTPNSDQVFSHLPQLAVAGDTVHVLWYDQDFTGTEPDDGARYCHSYDGGLTFSSPVTISSFDTVLNQPLMTSSGGDVYITFLGIVDTFYGTIVVRSSDAGSTWLPPQRLFGQSSPLAVDASNSAVYLVYRDFAQRTGILASTDAGETWTAKNSNIFPGIVFNSMIATPTRLHSVFTTVPPNQDLYAYFSTNSGTSWIYSETLSKESDLASSSSGRIAASGEVELYATWNDTGSIVMRRSKNNGGTWLPEVKISGSNDAVYADITAGREFVDVVWETKSDTLGNKALYIRASNDYGSSFCPADMPTASTLVGEPAIKIAGTTLHVVWYETVGGNDEIMYRRGTVIKNPRIGVPPSAYALKNNYPNPFNEFTHIGFEVPSPSHVHLAVYDLLGQKVADLVNEEMPTGRYEVKFSAKHIATGIYFYRLQTSTYVEIKKLLISR